MRLADTLLGKRGYGKEKLAPMVDLVNGAQFGPQTDLTSYVSNAAYVRRNLIARLIEAPRGFNDLPDPQRWIETLKALVELHPRTIEGLQSTLTAEFHETQVGGAGEIQQTVNNVTRARSVPVHTYDEKYGRPIQTFLNGWIRNLLMDPITKFPAVVSNGRASPEDLLPDYTGMTVLYFEPDPTHTKVVKAWLVTNMMPITDGTNEGRRDLTAANEGLELSIEWTALTQEGDGVLRFAQSLLDAMNRTGMNPNMQPAFIQRISADVNAGSAGYREQLAEASRTAIRP